MTELTQIELKVLCAILRAAGADGISFISINEIHEYVNIHSHLGAPWTKVCRAITKLKKLGHLKSERDPSSNNKPAYRIIKLGGVASSMEFIKALAESARAPLAFLQRGKGRAVSVITDLGQK